MPWRWPRSKTPGAHRAHVHGQNPADLGCALAVELTSQGLEERNQRRTAAAERANEQYSLKEGPQGHLCRGNKKLACRHTESELKTGHMGGDTGGNRHRTGTRDM